MTLLVYNERHKHRSGVPNAHLIERLLNMDRSQKQIGRVLGMGNSKVSVLIKEAKIPVLNGGARRSARRGFSEDVKASAVTRYKQGKESPKDIAASVGIAIITLRLWADAAGVMPSNRGERIRMGMSSHVGGA